MFKGRVSVFDSHFKILKTAFFEVKGRKLIKVKVTQEILITFQRVFFVLESSIYRDQAQ